MPRITLVACGRENYSQEPIPSKNYEKVIPVDKETFGPPLIPKDKKDLETITCF